VTRGRDGGATDEETWVVVPAGGLGVRMGRKKQGLPLLGRPVLRWTVDVLEQTPQVTAVVVAVPAADVASWRRRLRPCRKVRAVVAGGAERQESVARGLAAVPASVAWVAVHDGVRPCITPALVGTVLSAARLHAAAVAALPVAETLKRGVDGWIRDAVDRTGVWSIQTPQAFRAGVLREAHRRAAADGVLGTDEASLVERLGVPVRLVPGLPGNIKITRPDDLPLARAVLRTRHPGRVGGGSRRPAVRGRGPR
jgi:2-C-methyl-D-erythritol 4-phosphate cytidylyltransferase